MKNLIADILIPALKKNGVEKTKEEIINLLEIPPSPDLGDYAFPCFSLSKQLRLDASQIALDVREKIPKYPETDFEDIQTEGPYINFFVNRKTLALNLINEILSKKNNFGKTNFGEGKKILVEHTSINPNASPHVGRARNAILGDSLVRIFKFFNFRPEVHYYVNDVSKQIAMLVLAEAQNLKFEDMFKKYVEISKKVEKSKELQDEVFALLFRFEHENQETVDKFNKVTKTCVEGQKKILKKLGINYDYFDYESKYLKKSREILEILKKEKTFHKDREGRFYLDQRGTPIRKKMKVPVLILTRSDGTGLYSLRDIAYTLYKMKRAENNVIVLGEDQKLYFEQIKQALKLLKSKSPKVLHYSFILLNQKEKSKKMATRKGEVVLLEDFLDDAIKKAEKEIKKRKTKGDPKKVGISAIKYKILRNSPDKSILFNLDEALNFEGDTGPYLLYSYARANSILKKAKANKNKNFKIQELEPKEIALIKKLGEFKSVVVKAYEKLNPSLIANYSYELSQIFNEFYHSCQVIKSGKDDFRLALVKSFMQVEKNSLNLLGIDVLERM